MPDIEKIKQAIDKFEDCDKLDAYVNGIIDALVVEDAEEIEEYTADRKEEIASSVNPSGLEYPLYDHTGFKISTTSWSILNPDNLSYWKWLEEIALPMFWPQPRKDLQHKMLAILSAINTNAIPPRTKSARKEMQVPIPYIFGPSGSGKTEAVYMIANSYPTERFRLIKADSSGASLRNICHKLCYRGFADATAGWNNLFPALLLIDNYEPGCLPKWGDFKPLLLSVLRTQSVSSTALKEGGNQDYYSHVLKIFTSVIPPKVMSIAMEEFERRFVFLFTERTENLKSIAKYDFSDVPGIYANTWSLENVNTCWYPLLVDLLSRDDEETPISSFRWPQSICVIATGVYVGLFQTIQEGLDFMVEYWEWVESKQESMVNDTATLIDSMCEDAINKWVKIWKDRPDPDETTPLTNLPHITIPELDKKITAGVLDKKNAKANAKNYIVGVKGWQYGLDRSAGTFNCLYYLPIDKCIEELEKG